MKKIFAVVLIISILIAGSAAAKNNYKVMKGKINSTSTIVLSHPTVIKYYLVITGPEDIFISVYEGLADTSPVRLRCNSSYERWFSALKDVGCIVIKVPQYCKEVEIEYLIILPEAE